MGVGVKAIAAEHNYLQSFYLLRRGRNCHSVRGIQFINAIFNAQNK